MSTPSILISGCSKGGIGEALALEFCSRGFRVFAAVRDVAKAPSSTPRENGSGSDSAGSIEGVLLDVTSTSSIGNLISILNERLPDGRLDILVNNAGFGATGPLIEADMESVRKLYDVNVFGVLALTQACRHLLVKARGKVVNVSSIAGIIPLPWSGMPFPRTGSLEPAKLELSLITLSQEFSRD